MKFLNPSISCLEPTLLYCISLLSTILGLIGTTLLVIKLLGYFLATSLRAATLRLVNACWVYSFSFNPSLYVEFKIGKSFS